jgi:hypothetical protein
MTIGRTIRITSARRAVGVLMLILTSFAVSAPATAFPLVHTVTFAENASAADSVIAFETGTGSQSLTLLQNISPRFVDSGYIFKDWNTSADGSGASYADGSTFLFDSDVSLFAQWVAIPLVHTVTFFENDSASDSVSTYLSESAPTQLTGFASLQPTFTNSGYSFAGWNTSPSGAGIAYADGSQYPFSSDVSLYAQWNLIAVIPLVHTVTFFENDSASDSVNTIMSSSSTASITLESNLQPTFANSSLTFSAWNTSRDGNGVAYSDGAVFPFKSDLVLYAQWAIKNVDIISFSANGGDGAVTSISVSPGHFYVMPGQTGLIRAGYVLTGWNTAASGLGTKYLVGEQVTATESVRLYAQWSGHKPATLFSAIGMFKSNSSSLSPALKSQINRLARTIKLKAYRKISLYGYSASTGLRSWNVALSRMRAKNVATYLRHQLAIFRIRGVSVSSAGEGAIAGQTSSEYSRVEVFGA